MIATIRRINQVLFGNRIFPRNKIKIIFLHKREFKTVEIILGTLTTYASSSYC